MKRWVLIALSAVLLMAVGWGCESPGKPARIVFASGRDYKIEEHPLGSIQPWHFEIYIMNVDGSDIYQLTDNDWADITPAWQP